MSADESSNMVPCPCHMCQAGVAPEVLRYHHHIRQLLTRLTEPQRRWYVGFLSQEPDSPGERQLVLITGLARNTIAMRRIPGFVSFLRHFVGVRNASVHAFAALASLAAGFVHFFPRTP